MDPITAINQEFARQVQADWSRQAADEQSQPATPAPHTGLAAWLRARVPIGWVVFDKWFKAQQRRVGRMTAER